MNAPVILFVYNRPWHTEQTLTALSKNDLASDSVLYIYADGPKENASKEQLEKIKKVRELIKSKQWCKEVNIVESEKNKGLANSIIDGVTEIINKYGKIIVLEDDIFTSIGFLKFMNDVLELYENEEKLGGVTGFSFIESKENIYFLRQCGSWGWGTWKRVWGEVNFDIDSLIGSFNNDKLIKKFNADNSYPFYDMLIAQKEGRVDSWAIRFYASLFLLNKFFLYPHSTMVYNIGTDEGTHYKGGEKADIESIVLLQNINITKEKIRIKSSNIRAFSRYFRPNKKILDRNF